MVSEDLVPGGGDGCDGRPALVGMVRAGLYYTVWRSGRHCWEA